MKAAIFLCFALAVTFFGQTLGSADSRELERLENVWNEAHEHGDAATLESLWADDLEVAVPKMPVMTKTQVLSFALSGRMKFLHYAVVTGRLQRKWLLNEQKMVDDWRFTKTYVRAIHENSDRTGPKRGGCLVPAKSAPSFRKTARSSAPLFMKASCRTIRQRTPKWF
jgi:hypothetical protein